jgi:hypothetical protein
MNSIEIRVLGPAILKSAGLEDHYAHLLRLDPAGRALSLAGDGGQGIDGHCLRLMASQAILIGGYVDGVLRASVEIVPTRTGRQASAIFTAEPEFRLPGVTRLLLARLFDEARGYRMTELRLEGLDESEVLATAAIANGIAIEPGPPMRLMLTPPARAAAPVLEPAVNYA